MTALRYITATLVIFTVAALAGSFFARWSFDHLPPAWFDLEETDV